MDPLNNTVKTIVLLGILSALLVGIGAWLGGQEGMYMALGLALAMNSIGYFYSDRIAIVASGAKPVDQAQAPLLYAIVSELANQMQLPMPRLFIIPAQQANAFATGRNPEHASVAVTQGLLQILPREQIKAVLAHELAHVKNRDILIASIAAVLASAISFLANMSFYSSSDDDNKNPLIALLLFLLVPISASLIQLAISRQREFAADDSGAHALGHGKPLADALLAIDASSRKAPLALNPAFSSLYIGNPLGTTGGKLLSLFSTHPPVKKRIERLLAINQQ